MINEGQMSSFVGNEFVWLVNWYRIVTETCNNLWRTCEHVSRPCELRSFFHCASISKVWEVGLGWVVLYSIVLSSMMLFKRLFRLTRSLFILYVHENDCLGFGISTVETAVILLFMLIVPIFATEKVSRIRSNIVWKRWRSTLRARQDPYEWTWSRERKCKYRVLC